MNHVDLQAIAASFALRGSFLDGRPHGSGHINGFPLDIPPDDGWYDMATKYPWMSGGSDAGSEYVCPAEIDPKLTAVVQDAARKRAARPLSLRAGAS